MLRQNNYICAIDIGSSKIAACVSRIKQRGAIEEIFLESIPSRGIKGGLIVDSIGLVNSLTGIIKSLKAKSGINIKLVNVDISGKDILTKHSRAIIPLAERGNKVITASDMRKVNEQARILGSSLEEEIIQMVPHGYSIDSKGSIANPIGLYSHRLEVDLYLILAKLSTVQSLSRAINQSGYQIQEILFSGLGTSRAVFDKEFKQGMSLVCDIGADTTELLMFKEGVLTDIEIFSFGGDDLTAVLSEELKIPFELAEDLKRSHAIIGDSAQMGEDRQILVKKSNLYKPIRQIEVCQIITSKAESICLQLKKELEKKIPSYEVDNFIVAGRTLLLEGFIETLEGILAIPVKLGRIRDQKILSGIREGGEFSAQKYLTYLTSLGMLSRLLEEDKEIQPGPSAKPSQNLIARTFDRFKEVYQEYF